MIGRGIVISLCVGALYLSKLGCFSSCMTTTETKTAEGVNEILSNDLNNGVNNSSSNNASSSEEQEAKNLNSDDVINGRHVSLRGGPLVGNGPFANGGMLGIFPFDFSNFFGNFQSSLNQMLLETNKLYNSVIPEMAFNLTQTETCRYMLTFEDAAVSKMEMYINADNPNRRFISASYTVEQVRKGKNGTSTVRGYQQKTFSINPSCLVNAAIIKANLAGFVADLPNDGSELVRKFLVVLPHTEKLTSYEKDGLLPKGLASLLASGKPFDIELTKLQHCLIVKGKTPEWCIKQIPLSEQNDIIRVTSDDTPAKAEVFASTVGTAFRKQKEKLDEKESLSNKSSEKICENNDNVKVEKEDDKVEKVNGKKLDEPSDIELVVEPIDPSKSKDGEKSNPRKVNVQYTYEQKEDREADRENDVSFAVNEISKNHYANNVSPFLPTQISTSQENDIQSALENSLPLVSSGPQKLVQLEGMFEEL